MRKLNRLRKQKRPFTPDLFYIIEVNSIYQFRHRESHMVLSTATSLSEVKRYIVLILNRYKNYDQYLKAFNSLSGSAVTEKQKVTREKEYKRVGHKYTDVLKDIITEFYSERKEIEERRRNPLNVPIHEPIVTPNNTIITPRPLSKRIRRNRL